MSVILDILSATGRTLVGPDLLDKPARDLFCN
jgi:hypothetical protein